ncbi:MAG TPA: O-antigen ligase family protein [Thermoanaerobaculia bacterium]|nr:O-antigen ligase family protein [Thermoanaerobaculia bacterium]
MHAVSDMRRPGAAALVAVIAAIAALSVAVMITIGDGLPSTIAALTPLRAVAAVAFLILAVRFSSVGLPLLIMFVFLNLSEVLVRHHGFPSLLQMLVLALAFAAWLKRETAPLDEVLRLPLMILLLGFLLFSFFTTTLAVDPSVADARVIELGKSTVLCLLAVLLMGDASRIATGARTLAVAATVLSIPPIIQFATGDFSGDFGGLARIKQAHIYGSVFQPRIAGPLGDPNFFAQALLIPLPFMILVGATKARREKLLWLGASAIVLLTVMMTYSRGAMLALAVMGALLWKTLHVSWKATLGVAALLLCVVLLLPATVTERVLTIEQIVNTENASLHLDSSFEERRLLMQVAWIMFGENPLFGTGAGNYTVRYEDYIDRTGSAARQYEQASALHYPHNLLLETAAESGIVGVVLFVSIVLFAWLAMRPSRLSPGSELLPIATGFRIALVGFLVTSLFLHLAFPRYLYLLLAFAAALGRAAQRSESELAPVAADG